MQFGLTTRTGHFRERQVVAFRIRVDCAYRKPGEEHDEKRTSHDGWRDFHGSVATTGAPRKVPVSVFRKATMAATC